MKKWPKKRYILVDPVLDISNTYFQFSCNIASFSDLSVSFLMENFSFCTICGPKSVNFKEHFRSSWPLKFLIKKHNILI